MQGKYLDRAALIAGAAALTVVIGVAMVVPGQFAPEPATQNAEPDSTQAADGTRAAPTPGSAAQARAGGTSQAGAQTQPADATATAPAGAVRAAQDRERSPEERDVSAAVSRRLTRTIELLNAERFDEARAALDELMTAEAMARMTPFERSRLYQLSFNLNMNAENYEAATADLQAALESGGLTPQETSQMSYQRAQLFVQMEDYAKAADSLELWISDAAVPQQKPAHYLLAASYYYQDRFDDARDVMETLFTLPGENQEAWYAMMADLYMKNEDFARAKPVMETMVARYGRERYRTQLDEINATLEAR